jgi:hypothetical protein
VDGLFLVVIGFWAGYQWRRSQEIRRDFERRVERENDEFVDRLRAAAP